MQHRGELWGACELIETIRVTPLSDAVGAEVAGIDLSNDIADTTLDQIRSAFLAHHVLLFRNQELSPARQVRFTSCFGRVEPHPLRARRGADDAPEVLVFENRANRRGARNDFWHSDITFAEEPPALSILHALKVTPGVGDTMFCNMARAWNQLSIGMQRMLQPLRAMHSAEYLLRRNERNSVTDALPIENCPAPVRHPVMRTHPESKLKVLFVNPGFTLRFEDMTSDESKPLLDWLYTSATREQNIYRHKWCEGDVLMWDNRAVMHYAFYDYDETMPRLMHRTTASGDRPY